MPVLRISQLSALVGGIIHRFESRTRNTSGPFDAPRAGSEHAKVQTHSDASLALNDLTYEDALLDRQARTFFQAEYGDAEPAPGVYAKVLRAIKVHQEEDARRAPGVERREGLYARWR